MELSAETKEAIRIHSEGFKKYLQGDEGKDTVAGIGQGTELLQKLLAEDKLSTLSEADFSSAVMNLWAMNFWKNKQYKINQLLKDNGIAVLRDELRNLLFGDLPIGRRYDQFRKNVKGFGPAMITELLITMFHGKYCLWNQKPINVLPYLKMDTLIPEAAFKRALTGAEYAKCIDVMQLLWEELRLNGVIDVGPQATGFWIPDLFLWYLWDRKADDIRKSAGGADAVEGGRKEEAFGPEIKTHEGAQAMLLELGNLLGYDTYTADPGKDPGEQFYDEVKDEITGNQMVIPRTLGEIATLNEVPGFAIEKILGSVRRIDVIWFKEEFPEVCFEVEHTTNVKDGLLRQFQISRHVPAAKFFIVSPEDQRAKFEKEVETYPFSQIKRRYTFKSYPELVAFYNEASSYYKMKQTFGL